MLFFYFSAYKYSVKKPSVIICFILCAAVVAATVFSFFSVKEELKTGYRGILRLWNIDTFEGGKGSRTEFLKSAATEYEKTSGGIYVSVSSVTLSGYSCALENGNLPDMVSFGVGADFSSCAVKLLANGFVGGRIGDAQYAYPWCRGGYAIYCLDDDFSSVSPDNTVISCGGSNFPLAAAALFGLVGNYSVEDSTAAYVNFLGGKYKYLFGTQRDYNRFLSRGKEVFYKVAGGYNDVYQYISVLNSDADIYGACADFINCLLSDKLQKKLSTIGMIGVFGAGTYDSSGGALYEMQNADYAYTIGVFTGGEALSEIKTLAQKSLATGDTKKLKNYLKTVA